MGSTLLRVVMRDGQCRVVAACLDRLIRPEYLFVQVQQAGTDATSRIDRSHRFLKLQLRTIGCGGCRSSLAS